MSESTKTILSIPSGLQMLLRDLEFISQINRGQKACIASRTIVDGSTIKGKAYRWWNSEDRNGTITKIEEIVNRSIDEISKHQNTNYIGILINAFSKSRNGIETLLTTYQRDPDIISRIKVQLQNIDLQLSQYQHHIKGYAEEMPAGIPAGNHQGSQTNKVTAVPSVTSLAPPVMNPMLPVVSGTNPVIDESTKSAIDQEARRHRSRSDKSEKSDRSKNNE